MPRDNVSKLFSLSSDLEQFLDMPNTRQAIDGFVTAPCPDHWRQRGTVYRISNVFATSMGTPALLSRHAICGRCLAVGGNTALQVSPYVKRDDVIDDPVACLAIGAGLLDDESVEALQRMGHSDLRETWRLWAQDHDKEVDIACRSFDRYWSNSLTEGYLAQEYRVVIQPPSVYLPFVSLKRDAPKWNLQAEFSAAKETRHLIVLTAHQELTALYDWLVEWYESARAGSLHAASKGLDDNRLALLSTRTRGYRHWKRGGTTAYDDARDRRSDAPTEDIIPYCYLSSLYWDFYQLYSHVYEKVIKPKQCEGWLADGSKCTHAVRLIEGPGPKPTYCPQCIKNRERNQNTERQRTYRKNHPKKSVTPDNA